jgi:hypothetical protein
MRKRNLRNLRNNERGIALLIVLMALFLIAAIGMGMIYMSNTETAVNQNYRDTQQAFFTMRGGLEEMRDRMRTNGPPPRITVPAVMPSSGTAGSIVYILNPGASETVDPTTYSTTNKYFDDEFCHETFTTLTLTNPGTGVPCGAAGAPPSGAVTTVASVMPYTGTSSSLKYKWVRLTLKQNGTFPSALVAPLDSTHLAASQVCWDAVNNKEVVLSALGSTYANCAAARANGLMVEPVYIITALAITPQGSRRIGQYETAAISITPPDSGLSLDGPGSGSNFSPPSSNNSTVDGRDGSGPAPPALANCNTVAGATVPAIGASDITDRNNLAAAIPANRTGNYPGTAPTTTGATAIPSVVDMGSDVTGATNQLSNWSTPAQLNAMVSQISNAADYTYNCGMAGTGTPCSGTYGSVATPQITYINGDVILNGGAGVLVVTGNLNFNGPMQFDGLILVIGQGQVLINGGAGTDYGIYGAMFVAKTNGSSPLTTPPYAQLASLAAPAFTWNGGGKAGIYYNSCWANIGNGLHYMVVASREEMY